MCLDNSDCNERSGQRSGLKQITPAGFTLIEIMVALAILAIVVTIAYPSYAAHVLKSRRCDAVASLLERAQLLERCFTHFNAYNADGCPNPEGISANGYYAVTVDRTASTYTLTATPNAGQSSDPCGAFTLDHLGNRTPTPGSNRCWGAS